MSTALIELEDRLITDAGEAVISYDGLVRMARDGLNFHSHLAMDCPEIVQYNQISPRKIKVWRDDGEPGGPPEECYSWTTPEPFASMDVWTTCAECLSRKGLDNDDRYMDRLAAELEEMERRGMIPVLRQIAYMVSDFERRGVVWGVGRGSSCASLVLFLLGLNMVDPVEHEVPMEEFLR